MPTSAQAGQQRHRGASTLVPGSVTWRALEAKSHDDFIHDQIDLSREAIYGAVQRIADSRELPPATFSDVIVMLERDGLVESAAALRP